MIINGNTPAGGAAPVVIVNGGGGGGSIASVVLSIVDAAPVTLEEFDGGWATEMPAFDSEVVHEGSDFVVTLDGGVLTIAIG